VDSTLSKKKVHALLQALVFVDQGVAHHDARHARVLLTELHEQGHQAPRAQHGVGFAVVELVDEAEHRLLDELDQSLEHLRLAGEVAVQRGLAHVQAGGQRSGGHAVGARLLEHGGQSLQNLHPALTRLGSLSASRRRGIGGVQHGIARGRGLGQVRGHGRSVQGEIEASDIPAAGMPRHSRTRCNIR